jgi:hypothetical protein
MRTSGRGNDGRNVAAGVPPLVCAHSGVSVCTAALMRNMRPRRLLQRHGTLLSSQSLHLHTYPQAFKPPCLPLGTISVSRAEEPCSPTTDERPTRGG